MKKLQFSLLISLLFWMFSVHAQTNSSIKVALILDTSNSMDGLIDQAKAQLWSVVNELSDARCDGRIPSLEIALYEYGNDRLPMREGYIRLVTPFARDLDLISEKLFALKTDGGSEYCGQVIQTSVKALDWGDRPNDLKMIFIAGNEPFDQGNINYRDACRMAYQSDISVNTIFCGDFQEGVNTFWKDGATLGRGDYMNIDQDCSYRYVKSPYDEKIMELNQQLNKTYVAYGAEGSARVSLQAEQDANAVQLNMDAAISRVASKSKKTYNNTQWDLVDASEEDEFQIAEIAEEALPDEMKGMTAQQKADYIQKKKLEREKISQEIAQYSAKRQEYVAKKQQEESGNMLDKAIVTAVKAQAKAKNITFVEE